MTCLPWAPWSLRCFIISLSLCLAINLSISLLIFFVVVVIFWDRDSLWLWSLSWIQTWSQLYLKQWGLLQGIRRASAQGPPGEPLSPFPPATTRAAGYILDRHRWRALWLSRKWQAQTRREAGKSDAHSLTKCRHAGRTMKTIRTEEMEFLEFPETTWWGSSALFWWQGRHQRFRFLCSWDLPPTWQQLISDCNSSFTPLHVK